MEAATYALRLMRQGRDVVQVFTDRREAGREYFRLLREKAPVALACRLPKPKAA